MSMNRFEEESDGQQWEDSNPDTSSLLITQELGLPDDFTAEDIAFAQEMKVLFSLEEEEVPPYYVQTILEVEDPRLQPVDQGLELRTSTRVFRRLQLRRRLFRGSRSFLSFISFPTRTTLRQPLIAFVSACLLFMFVTMAMAGPSFASGLSVLLSGTHSGVLQVQSYPWIAHTNPRTSHTQTRTSANSSAQQAQTTTTVSAKEITLQEAQQSLTFSMYQPLFMPNNYELHSTSLYQGADQNWADGPVIEFDYTYTRPGIAPHGTGNIAVCEFKPNGKVLQVVQEGAAQSVHLNNKTHKNTLHAIYVSGQWVRINEFSHVWVYGERSEIIYEQNGVIFWIVGDQGDGIDQNVLLNIAASLQPVDVIRTMRDGDDNFNTAMLYLDNSTWMFADEVIYVDSSGGPSLRIVSTSTPELNSHAGDNSQAFD